MPLRFVKDNAYASGNPAGTGKPFQAAPRLEPYDAVVLDTTGAGFAAIGKILVEAWTDKSGASFAQSATVNQALPLFRFGAVVSPAGANANNASGLANQAAPNQSQARITQCGDCLALATSTANANKAINVGDPLCLDGAGNLTSAPATPAAGSVVAIAKQALAGGTAAATMIAVSMGGY